MSHIKHLALKSVASRPAHDILSTHVRNADKEKSVCDLKAVIMKCQTELVLVVATARSGVICNASRHIY